MSPATAAWPPTASYVSRRTRMYCPFAAATGERGSLTFDGGYCRASSAKTTGSVAISQKVTAICSGEYESSSAPCCWASDSARASEPSTWTVSASVNRSHWPRAWRAPVATALFLPVQPLGRGAASITLTFGNDPAISRVRSVEWSSTTMISKSTPVCATSDSRHVPRLASSLRAGIITDTMGASFPVCPVMVSAALIGGIYYYSCVRHIPGWYCLIPLLRAIMCGVLLLGLTACYSGSRPLHIGSSAPEFTVQDDDRKVTLNQFRGQVVVLNFWATWCPPCIEETPSLVVMQERLKAKGITVVAISVDVDENAYRRFLKDHGVNLVTVRDPDQKTSNLYGTFKFPETYVIDRNGVMRRKFIGAVDWTEPEITDFLSRL